MFSVNTVDFNNEISLSPVCQDTVKNTITEEKNYFPNIRVRPFIEMAAHSKLKCCYCF